LHVIVSWKDVSGEYPPNELDVWYVKSEDNGVTWKDVSGSYSRDITTGGNNPIPIADLNNALYDFNVDSVDIPYYLAPRPSVISDDGIPYISILKGEKVNSTYELDLLIYYWTGAEWISKQPDIPNQLTYIKSLHLFLRPDTTNVNYYEIVLLNKTGGILKWRKYISANLINWKLIYEFEWILSTEDNHYMGAYTFNYVNAEFESLQFIIDTDTDWYDFYLSWGDMNYPAKFLTEFIEPKRFIDYPWDISIIYSELLSGETLVLKETPLDINESAGTPAETTLDDGEIEYINRIIPQKVLEAADAYTKIEILNDTPDVLLSESKIITNDQECKDNPLYLRWINLLGGREYWLFSHHQEFPLEIDNINLIERDITNIETAEAIQDIISKEGLESIIIGEDNLQVLNVEGMKGLLLSPLVQMLTNPASWESEGPKWKTVIVKKNTWNLYRNDRGTYSLELEIGLPRLNIQTR